MRWLFGRRDRDLDEEIRTHLAMAERDRLDRGEDLATARAHARREFGNTALLRQVARELSPGHVLDQFGQDLRIALRRLGARPTTTLTAVVMLGLAVGITTAMWTVVDAFVFRPMPFQDADRIAHLMLSNQRGGRLVVEPAVLHAWRESAVFEEVEGVTTDAVVLETDAGPVSTAMAFVTAGLFDMLGVHAVRGRLFDVHLEGSVNADAIVVSEDLWRTVFSADPAIIGRRIRLGLESVVVVGVLPPEFRFPEWNTQIWRPIAHDIRPPGPAKRPRPYVKFSPTVPEADALRAASEAAHRVDPTTAGLHANRATAPHEYFGARYVRTAVRLLAGGVTLVFLVLCVNVACLFLIRFNDRRHEFGMCSALGASRTRLLRQSALESGLVGAAGAAAGLVLAWALVAVARHVLPMAFLSRSLNPVNLDGRALWVAAALTMLATVIAGWLPAYLGTRSTTVRSMLGRTTTEPSGSRTLTRILLTAEITFACALLVSAALLVRSFANLSQIEPGFEPKGLVTLWTVIEVSGSGPAGTKRAIAAQAADALAGLPRVRQVGLSSGSPFAPSRFVVDDWQPDSPDAQAVPVRAELFELEPKLFDIYGIRLIRGRLFETSDPAYHVVLSERLASLMWPGADAVGRSYTWKQERYHVIGVVADTRRPVQDLESDYAEVYRPFQGAESAGYPTFSVRCDAPCPSEGQMRRQLMMATPAVRVLRVSRLDELYGEELAQPRAMATLGLVFGVLALTVAASGLFTVLSHAVGRRRREFGIRLALGSTPAQVWTLVMRDGLRVALAGLGLGSIAAWLLARTLRSLLYGVTPSDPLTWSVVLVALLTATLAGAWRPATQAMRVSPIALLREE
jgi:predicted permease